MSASLEPVRGFAQVAFGSPLQFGQVYRHAWAMEHPFPRLDDRQASGSPSEDRQPWLPTWQFEGTGAGGCQTIPSLRALSLSAHPEWMSHRPVFCANEAELKTVFGFDERDPLPTSWVGKAGTWGPDSPIGYNDTIWLRCEKLSATTPGYGHIQTYMPWMKEPSFQFLLWRWSPAGTLATRPYVTISVGVNKDGVGGVSILLPSNGSAGSGSKPSRVQVATTRMVGGDVETLAELDQPSRVSRIADTTPQLEVVTLRSIEPGAYILTVGDSEALIFDSDTSLKRARIDVWFVDCLGSFTIYPMVFPYAGVAKKVRATNFPLWTNGAGGELLVRSYAPEGSSVTGTLTEEAGEDERGEAIVLSTLPTLTFSPPTHILPGRGDARRSLGLVRRGRMARADGRTRQLGSVPPVRRIRLGRGLSRTECMV
jgi:hypothetical protein